MTVGNLTFHIRTATPADAGTLVSILIASKEASFPELLDAHDRDTEFWTGRWKGYLATGSRAKMSRGDGFALLAERNGRAVGFAAYHHTRRHDTDAELESIYVLREVQRRGLGTELLSIIGGRLREEGSRSLCVGYDPRNPYKSFYLKHGAVEINPHWAVWRDISKLT